MSLPKILSALALLAITTIPATAPAQQKKPAPTDWTRTVTLAPNGAYILGNPRAATRIVEYFSYTCSHCAHFAAEATEPRKADSIWRGTVSDAGRECAMIGAPVRTLARAAARWTFSMFSVTPGSSAAHLMNAALISVP